MAADAHSTGIAARLDALIERDRIAPEVYSDPALFELEMDRLFGRAWLYIGHECQVPESGDYFTTRLGRHDVIVVRDQDGRIQVLHNRCTHRGPHLCAARAAGSAGSCVRTTPGLTSSMAG